MYAAFPHVQEASKMLSEATALAAQLEQAQRTAAAAQAAIQSFTAADDHRTSQLESEVGACV